MSTSCSVWQLLSWAGQHICHMCHVVQPCFHHCCSQLTFLYPLHCTRLCNPLTPHSPLLTHLTQAFLAGCFRYLYLGQFATKPAALVARNTALVAIYGPKVAKSHGVKRPEDISEADMRAMAAKLANKPAVVEVMQRHDRGHLLPQKKEKGKRA